MTGSTTAIGYNRRCPFHYRFPIRVSHIRDQNFAFLEVMDTFHAVYDIGNALTDAFPVSPSTRLRDFIDQGHRHQ